MAWLLVMGLAVGCAFGSGAAVTSLVSANSSSVESTTTTTTATALSTTSTASTSSDITVTDVSDVVAEVMPSIVAITAVSVEEYPSMFGQMESYESESAGSGVIIAQDDDYLYIVTNNHVISGASSLTVTFSDDSYAEAEVQGADSENDLAVVKISLANISDETLEEIKVATIGDSDALEVGDSAIAIGNALGYGQSVTTGVISALNREVSMEDEDTGETVTNELIQTDAAINPGNSGGALINSSGELIGINSAKYSDTDVEGMGFAIPMSTALPIIQDIIANGSTDEDTASDDSSESTQEQMEQYIYGNGGSGYGSGSGNGQEGGRGGFGGPAF